jgi:hypothetical protein
MIRDAIRIPQGLTYSFFLAGFWSAAGLCAVAVYLGRSAPATAVSYAPQRWPSSPLVGVNFCNDSSPRAAPFVLNPETGAIVSGSLPDASHLDLLGFSPWRDVAGEFHLIARRRACPGGNDSADEMFGLSRYAFPSGRLLDHVSADTLPIGAVCWFPDRSDRIVFAAADGRLYLHDFAAGPPAERLAAAPRPRPLRWQGDPPWGGPIQIQDPCWPAEPRLGGRLLVAMTHDADDADSPSGQGQGPQLWWLRLDPDTATIAAEARVIVPDRGGRSSISADEEERLPCIGTAHDGTLMLAYLARSRRASSWDLRVAPMGSPRPDRPPSVLRSSGRTLAEGCVPLALAFAADGQWVYVSRRGDNLGGPWGTLRRYAVAPGY